MQNCIISVLHNIFFYEVIEQNSLNVSLIGKELRKNHLSNIFEAVIINLRN
uniref:Uncharacterized protein n=1 Tax=Anguilla anguilla TaxID=7936 RepID=A0A0E9XH53_ANGAN